MVQSAAFDPTSCLILAVDDMPVNLKVLQGVLTASGYRITFATGGQQVLERLQQLRPDLILLDLMMPEMSGLEVCRRINQQPDTAHIPIIFLTASHEIDHLVQAFDGGAVDYVTKPFNTVELLSRVRTHLELSHWRKQAQRHALWESLSRQIVQDIHQSLQLQEVLDYATQSIQTLLQAQRVMIYRWCDPLNCKRLLNTEDVVAIEICNNNAGCPFLQENPAPMPVVQKRRLCLLDQSLSHYPTSLAVAQPASTDLGSLSQDIQIPIYQRHQLWGGLVVQNPAGEPPWGEGERETLNLIVRQLEISIQHAELHRQIQEANQELERISNTDALTQVANRRHFDAQLSHEWQRLGREQQSLSVILCDIDYFKQFNDTYGHLQGDACLVAVAQALRGCLKRPADFLARYGGEEFVVILPATPLSGAIEVVEQMQQAIAKLAIVHATHVSATQVTLSFGLYATVPSPGTSAQTIFAAADYALYQAKANGRDRYAIFTAEVSGNAL